MKELSKQALPDISIITPSFNMLDYLKLNAASVCDQEGVTVEHIVVDGGSSDGTVHWLQNHNSIRFTSERDKGMYDALNKGYLLAVAEIVGHLNCDEQYLPGTLNKVVTEFRNNPEIDFIVADFLVVDKSGELLAYRKSFKPKWVYFFSNYLYTVTCTTFYRKKIFETNSFDISYRSIADMKFMYTVLKMGYKGKHLRQYFSTFSDTGNNLSLNEISNKERKRLLMELPLWYRFLRPLFFFSFYFDRWLSGGFKKEKEINYAIYKTENPGARSISKYKNPVYRWSFGK